MRITDIFDAVRDGTYADFRKFYTGDPNLFNKYAGMSLLQLAFVNDRNAEEKIKIIQFLISYILLLCNETRSAVYVKSYAASG